ncbi:MAG: D-glycero-beta-D-manno-heptose-7-phosphate kinase [Elusimicrobia bacterium]|nr:D-glycero-beta-D-manno-heptose-7-phosphate kinase [Elusimicrobiota bacterium]
MPRPAERQHPRGRATRPLRSLLSRFPNKRILVIGDLMLDQYIRGSVARLSPEAPVPVVRVSQESFIPGGAGNVASNLAALEAQVILLGVVGNDGAGRELRSQLGLKGIPSDHLLCDPERVTAQKCRVIAERQQMVRYDRENGNPIGRETENLLLGALAEALKTADAVILSDYGKGVLTPRVLERAISGARRRGIPITVDPKIEHFRRYRKVSCLTPNLQEAWAGLHRPPKKELSALEELGRDIMRILRSQSLLITRGPEGMSLFKDDGQVEHIPTQAREVFDVTGAGDTVISVLTLALSCGASIRDAAIIANHAAGIVVGKLGTAVAGIEEIKKSL